LLIHLGDQFWVRIRLRVSIKITQRGDPYSATYLTKFRVTTRKMISRKQASGLA